MNEIPIFEEIDLMLLRKSRSDNIKEPIEITLKRHEEQLQELCIKTTGKPVKEENIYREIVSGGENIKDRPDFLRLLRRLENGNIKRVWCVDPERLSRSGMYGAGDVLKIFDVTNTLIATLDQTYDLKNPMDKKYLEMRMIQSAEYRNYAKDVMNRGRHKSVRDGYYIGSSAPFGYKRKQLHDEKDRFILEPHEEESQTVILMFEMLLEGVGTSNLANHLNKYKYKARKNEYWTPAMVRNIVTSEVYCGYNTWEKFKTVEEIINGEVVKKRKLNDKYYVYKGKHKALISEEEFKSVQEILKSHPSSKNGGNKKASNPLAGVIICKKCGRHMVRRPYNEKHLKNGFRKYKYDKQELLDFMRSSKEKTNLSLSQIAKKMNISRDTVKGWFPTNIDKFYDGKNLANHWYQLKEVLEIEDSKWDKIITTYNKKVKQNDSLICLTPFCDNVSSELQLVEKRLLQALEIQLNDFRYYVDNYEQEIIKEAKSNAKTLNKIEKQIEDLKKELKNLRRSYNREEFTYDEYVEDKNDIESELKEIEKTKEEILKDTNQDKIIRYKKAIPILADCLKQYDKLSIQEKNNLLKDIFVKVEYEKNEGGRWNKEAIDKFTLTPHLKILIDEIE